MSKPPSDTEGRPGVDLPGLSLPVEGPDGSTQALLVPIRPPADPDAVIDLIGRLDAFFEEEAADPADATLGALLLSLAASMQVNTDWPVTARLDAFLQQVTELVEDARSYLDTTTH